MSEITIMIDGKPVTIDLAQHGGSSLNEILQSFSENLTINEFVHKYKNLATNEWWGKFSRNITKEKLLGSLGRIKPGVTTRDIDSRMSSLEFSKSKGPTMDENERMAIIYVNWCEQLLDKNGRLPTKSCFSPQLLDVGIKPTNSTIFCIKRGLRFNDMPNHVVLAGGSVASMLFHRMREDKDPGEDVDLWITGPTVFERLQAFKECLKWLGPDHIYTLRGSCMTLVSKSIKNAPNIQVIYTKFCDPAQLVSSFDMPMVRAYVDNTETCYFTTEMLFGIANKEFYIDCQEMTTSRWPKLYRYPGATFHIVNCDSKIEGEFKNSPAVFWTPTDYGYKFTVEQMTPGERREFCEEHFYRMDDVYEKYYHYNSDLTEDRNSYFALKILNAEYASSSWRILWPRMLRSENGFDYRSIDTIFSDSGVNGTENKSQDSSTAEAASSSQGDTTKKDVKLFKRKYKVFKNHREINQEQTNQNTTIYRDARWNLQVWPHIQFSSDEKISAEKMEIWYSLWRHFTKMNFLTHYDVKTIIGTQREMQIWTQKLPQQILIKGVTLIVDETQSYLDRDQVQFHLETANIDICRLVESAEEVIVRNIRESSLFASPIYGSCITSCNGVISKIQVKGTYSKHFIGKVIKADVMLDLREIEIKMDKSSIPPKSTIFIKPHIRFASPVEYKSSKIFMDEYIWSEVVYQDCTWKKITTKYFKEHIFNRNDKAYIDTVTPKNISRPEVDC